MSLSIHYPHTPVFCSFNYSFTSVQTSFGLPDVSEPETGSRSIWEITDERGNSTETMVARREHGFCEQKCKNNHPTE
jgi:hypothetical protein